MKECTSGRVTIPTDVDAVSYTHLSDGNHYGVPVNGYWEGLFVNTKLLKDAGVDVPDENTTWEEFIKDCEALKEKGITPISASLATEIHYWFEFCISVSYTHLTAPLAGPDTLL